MPWRETKKRIISCLEEGRFLHEQRNDINIKNLLATGQVSSVEVAAVLKRTRGNEHEESPHHLDRRVTVHTVKVKDWYIKWYFVEPDAMFISVH